jgi:uncharacterized oxidoreductase
MTVMHLIPAEKLRAAVQYLVAGFGSEAREIKLVTENLVQANLTGHDSHGVGMLPRYTDAYLEGGLKPNAHIKTCMDSGAMLALDGQTGFGQVIGHETMELGIARAKEHGSCIVALGNSHHLCRIGAWAEMAIAENLISVHFVNVVSRPIVAPWGGADARFGTNPFSVGIPVKGGEPILLDFATSVVAQGKTRVAHNKGEQLPPGQMLDDKGNPTTDPRYGVIEPYGALRTFGEHKGFGMALICELLGGALAAGMTCRTPADGRKQVLNGMLTIIFDPEKFGQGGLFQEEMRSFVEWVRASPSQPGQEGVRIAGEPERATRAKRLAEGIPVDENTWKDMQISASKLGLDPAKMNQLAGM